MDLQNNRSVLRMPVVWGRPVHRIQQGFTVTDLHGRRGLRSGSTMSALSVQRSGD